MCEDKQQQIERLEAQVSALKERVAIKDKLIEQQRAEILMLQQRNYKSQELKEVFEKPSTKTNVKSFTIDNR